MTLAVNALLLLLLLHLQIITHLRLLSWCRKIKITVQWSHHILINEDLDIPYVLELEFLWLYFALLIYCIFISNNDHVIAPIQSDKY